VISLQMRAFRATESFLSCSKQMKGCEYEQGRMNLANRGFESFLECFLTEGLKMLSRQALFGGQESSWENGKNGLNFLSCDPSKCP
jgi:hypothetical protein